MQAKDQENDSKTLSGDATNNVLTRQKKLESTEDSGQEIATLDDDFTLSSGITTETWSTNMTSNEGHQSSTQSATKMQRR